MKQSNQKNITYLKAKDNFLEIGSLHGYNQTVRNFKKIYNEIHRTIP